MTTVSPECAASVEVDVDLEMDDLIHASYALFFRRARFMLLLHGLLVLTGIVVALSHTSAFAARSGTVWFGIIVLLVLPVLGLALVYWSAVSQFERATPKAATMSYRFSPAALEISSEVRSGWLPWEAISEALETKKSFLLFLSPDEHYVLPKRCFPNSEDIDSLRTLLREQVGTKARLKEPTGA